MNCNAKNCKPPVLQFLGWMKIAIMRLCFCCCCGWLYPSPEYIAHSAINSFADFERPLLAPQPTDLDDKKRGLFQISCSIFSSHQNVNLDTFSKTLYKQKAPAAAKSAPAAAKTAPAAATKIARGSKKTSAAQKPTLLHILAHRSQQLDWPSEAQSM